MAATEAYNKAVAYLTRREHCRFELKQKLTAKGYAAAEINAALDLLEERGYLSEERYVEVMVRHRAKQGYGEQRIRQQLQAMHVNSELISVYLQEHDWTEILREVWQKKFKGMIPADVKQKRKQINFLVYRGFAMSKVQSLLNGLD